MSLDKKFLCKKNLYKSTYKANAFTKGKEYDVDHTESMHVIRNVPADVYGEDDNFVYIIDNLGRSINFSKRRELPYYWIEDYFYI